MRVIVTGGTGFVGSKLVSALLERGDEVDLLTRDPNAVGVTHARLRAVAWGAPGDRGWEAYVDGAGAVVHLAGANVSEQRWTPERLQLLRSSRIDTAERLVAAMNAARRCPPVLLSASAVGFYGMRKDDRVQDESSAPGDDTLAQLVRDWEAASLRATSFGVRVAHARLGLVLGADGGVLGKMVSAFKGFVGGPLGSGEQWFSWVHWLDAVRAMLFAIDTTAVTGPFNVTAPHPVTMNEFARTLGHVLRRPSLARVPALALRLLLGADLAEVLLTGQRVVPSRLEHLGFTFRFPRLEGALREALSRNG